MGEFAFNGTTTTNGAVWCGNTSTYTWYSPYGEHSGGPYVIPLYTGTNSPKEIDMKGNGKEFLVFAKGGRAPVKACESEAKALDEASVLADKNDETYFIYKAVKRVSPVRTDLEVTDL